MSHQRLDGLLREWTSIRLAVVAEGLGVSEEVALELCRAAGAPVFSRAGSSWVQGRRPHRAGDKPQA